jgi:hypothetical protein
MLSAWLLPRVVELTYTAWDLQPFAADCGFAGPPFRWDEERGCPHRPALPLAARLAAGAVRTITDLLAALPDGPFPLRLTEADLGPGQPADWTFRPLAVLTPLAPPE